MTQLPAHDLVIFDCDGVLIDSEAIFVSAELEFLESHGFSFERADYVRDFMGIPSATWRARVAALIAEHRGQAPPTDLFEPLDETLEERLTRELVAIEGAQAFLDDFSKAKCVASSSSIQGLHWKLEFTGLIDHFSPHVFSAELVDNGKPAPDLFLHAAASLEVRPEHCLVIEDSSNGVIAARRAGMTVIGLTAGGHCIDGHAERLLEDGAELVVDSYGALRALLD